MGKIEALAYQVSRGVKNVAEFGLYQPETIERNKAYVEEIKAICEDLGCNVAFVDSEGGVAVVLYKHQWALDAYKWLYNGDGKGGSLNQRHRDWILGLLYGFGSHEIAEFYNRRVEEGWYEQHESKETLKYK